MSGVSKAIEVDPARRSQWRIPSAIRALDPERVRWLLPLHAAEGWEAGDLLTSKWKAPSASSTAPRALRIARRRCSPAPC